MEEEEFLTAREAAKWLQVHRNTIYAMVKEGRLKGYSLRPIRPFRPSRPSLRGYSSRRCLCFRRTDIEQLLERHRVRDSWAMAKNEFVTVQEAANLLLVHPSIIRHMVKEGRLKAYPIGKRLRFKREDIKALLGK